MFSKRLSYLWFSCKISSNNEEQLISIYGPLCQKNHFVILHYLQNFSDVKFRMFYFGCPIFGHFSFISDKNCWTFSSNTPRVSFHQKHGVD